MQRARVLEDGHELGFSQHMPLDGVHQLILDHLVAEVHLVVEDVELELDAVAAGGRDDDDADIGARRWSSSREVSPSAGDVKMQRVRVLEDGHELGFSQHMPLDGVHQLILDHL
jgi:hypothetical protein